MARTRGIVIIAIAFYWATLTAVYSMAWQNGWFVHDATSVFCSQVFAAVSTSVVLPLIPRIIVLDGFNRRFAGGMVSTLLFALLAVGLCAWAELPPHVPMFVQACVYASGLLNGAIFGDARLGPGSAVCMFGAIAAIAHPAWSWEVVNTTNMLTLVLIGWVWFDPERQALACVEDAIASSQV